MPLPRSNAGVWRSRQEKIFVKVLTTSGGQPYSISQLTEALPDPMVAVNPDGIILQISFQIEGMFGYTRDELVGQPVEVLVPNRLRQRHQHHQKQFGEQLKVRRMGAGLDLYGRRRDGSEFPVEISLSPVTTSNGMIVLSAIRDISDRKRIEEELRRVHKELDQRKDRQLWQYQSRLASIVDSSRDAVIGKNLDGIITNWNKGAEYIYGYSAEEMIGKPISILAPKERAGRDSENPGEHPGEPKGRVLRVRACHQGRQASECFHLGVSHSRCGRQHCGGPRRSHATSRRRSEWKTSFGKRKRWKRWDDWQGE